MRSNDIAHVTEVLANLARALDCTRAEAGKAVRRLHNEKRGLVKMGSRDSKKQKPGYPPKTPSGMNIP